MSDYVNLQSNDPSSVFVDPHPVQTFALIISILAFVLCIILGICWKFVPDNAEKTKSVKIRNAFYGMLVVLFVSLCIAFPQAIPNLFMVFSG